MHEAFPDIHFTIEDQIAEGDKVVTRWTCRGTHQGEFFGIPPTGETVTWEYFDMGLVRNGKFAERWGLDDTAAILQQLGVMEMP